MDERMYTMRNTITAAEVWEHFCLENIEETVKSIAETMDKMLDYNTSEDLLIAAAESMDEESRKNCNLYDKLTWIARQCYLRGFVESFKAAFESANMTYNEIFQVQGALSNE